MGVHDRVHIRPGIVDRGMNHGLTGRIFQFGNRPLIPCLGIILFADFHVFINIDFNNMLGGDFTERRQDGLDKKLSRAWNPRTHMAMVIGQSLVEHDPVPQRDLPLEFFEILLACFHLGPLSGVCLRCLLQVMRFRDGFAVLAFAPPDVHPIPLIGIFTDRSFEPLSDPKSVLCDLRLASSRAIQL